MFDFILQGSRIHERAMTATVKLAMDEIRSKYLEEWGKSEKAKRCHEQIALPFHEALESQATPRLLLSLATGKKKNEIEAVEFGDPIQTEDLIHFLQIKDTVFPIMARDQGHKKTAVYLYAPIALKDYLKKKDDIPAEGMKALYGKRRSELEAIKLLRDRPPTTSVQFGDSKVYDDQSYAWALWEAASSALRRGYTTALRESGYTDSIAASDQLGAARVQKGPVSDFRAALPYLIQKLGRAEADGPPLGNHLLHAFSWETGGRGLPVVITGDQGMGGTIHAFVRDRIGDKPAWIELLFPKNAKIPAAGVSATLEGSRLRIFGGIDGGGEGLNGEWFYELERGRPSAYRGETFRVGQNLPSARAWAATLSTDISTVLVGGVAKFVVQQGKKEKFAAQVRAAIEQARSRKLAWAERQPALRNLTGASVVVDGDLAYVGPQGAVNARDEVIDGFDGKVDFFDARNANWMPLEDLPEPCALGQLHRADNLLFYSGGFVRGEDGLAKPADKIWALDLEQLGGWVEVGSSPFVRGSTKLVLRDDALVAIALTPMGRMTFVPGVFDDSKVEGDAA